MRVAENLVPELRFPGFEGQIVTSLIRDLCTTIVDCVNKTAPTVDYETPYRMIRTNNVRDGKLDLSNVRYVTKEIFNIWNRRGAPQKGDLIFTREAPVGEMGILYEKEGIFLGQRTMMYRANVNVCSNIFLLNSLQTRYCQRQIDGFSNGGTVAHMRVPDCGKIKVLHPVLPEQKKIASFLSAVDKKIEKLTRKKELLEKYKKGVMQKIFSREIRFKDENGTDYPDWEEQRLGEICDLKRGASPRPISDPKWFDSDSKIGWVRISDVTNSKKYLNKTVQYLSSEGISKSRLVEAGNIIMSICATIGKPIYTQFQVCIHDGFVVFENLKSNKEYLFYYLENIQEKWYRYGQPGTQVNLNTGIVGLEKMPYPAKKEQKKIANFLSTIDKKIEAIQIQLTQTQKFKKGLLQKMFV